MVLSTDGRSGKADIEGHSSADCGHAADIPEYCDVVLGETFCDIIVCGLAMAACCFTLSQALVFCIAELYAYIHTVISFMSACTTD